MMHFLDDLARWVCNTCYVTYYTAQAVLASDPDPEMQRTCRECGC